MNIKNLPASNKKKRKITNASRKAASLGDDGITSSDLYLLAVTASYGKRKSPVYLRSSSSTPQCYRRNPLVLCPEQNSVSTRSVHVPVQDTGVPVQEPSMSLSRTPFRPGKYNSETGHLRASVSGQFSRLGVQDSAVVVRRGTCVPLPQASPAGSVSRTVQQ